MNGAATRAAQVVFAVLVVATFGAFFVAQRLKHGPTLVQKFARDNPVFSPNRDGRLDKSPFRFVIKNDDDVTVDIVDSKGDRVRRMADNRFLRKYTGLQLKWDGTDDSGALVPDGTYRVRIALRREGRSLTIPKAIVKDTVAPVVKVRLKGSGTSRYRPELLPNPTGDPIDITVVGPPGGRRVTIFRTYPGPVERVVGPAVLAPGVDTYRWDGTRRGRNIRPGTYLVVADARDRAGNIGSSVPVRRDRDRTPIIRFGQGLPGRGGITVRYLGVQPPATPVPAGRSTEINFDSRGQPVTWGLRRAGGPPGYTRKGSAATPPLKVPIPRGESGLYVLTVRTKDRRQTVPIVVRAGVERKVLVVLPSLTWGPGTNPADDDGDGVIDTLTRGVGAKIERISIGDGTGMPIGVGTHEAKLLAYLDRKHHRYDLTTDARLLGREGLDSLDPETYTGVLIAGDARWLPRTLGTRLRRYVRRGGRVASLGTQSLRAEAEVSGRGRLVHPTALAEDDLFGSAVGKLLKGVPTTLTGTTDRIGLFEGGTGELTGFSSYEETTSPGKGNRVLAQAVNEKTNAPVVIAYRFGKGIVMRTGLPEFAMRLDDGNTSELMERTWTLLSR